MSAYHRRTSSGSTVRLTGTVGHPPAGDSSSSRVSTVIATVWTHDDTFSAEDVLINSAVLEGTNIRDGDLIQIVPLLDNTVVRDFHPSSTPSKSNKLDTSDPAYKSPSVDRSPRVLCLTKIAPPEIIGKQMNLQVSLKSTIANVFNLRSRSQVELSLAKVEDWTASHVEIIFRDTYLSRSDMWRMVGQELAGKSVYTRQRITFLGTMRVVVKAIHVHGHKVTTAFFSHHTVPVFRSEAARYVLFIQMSREMWDFDSEGHGEILFSRVVDGFLPDLFKRWSELEVRHLVSIVLFGRLEYNSQDLSMSKQSAASQAISLFNRANARHQDFYRVVVTDMASAQWTAILDELKKDFRVFLRDISLHLSDLQSQNETVLPKSSSELKSKIIGQPSTALRGNILEAINIASTQFANDYLDRDLIRTGISVVVITAGTGVFEVDRDLMKITSENLTNNGIGIDIVCLSKMPLHSVPLFKYRTTSPQLDSHVPPDGKLGLSPNTQSRSIGRLGSSQPAFPSSVVSSVASGNAKYLSRYASSMAFDNPRFWSLGVPHWIDLSYWSINPHPYRRNTRRFNGATRLKTTNVGKTPFEPRVRMYEVQMMGLMELGMADITIPFLSEEQDGGARSLKRQQSNERSRSQSPTLLRKTRRSGRTSTSNQGLLSSQARALGDIFDRMDAYDATLFKPGLVVDKKNSSNRPTQVTNTRPESKSVNNANSTAGSIAKNSESPKKSSVIPQRPKNLSKTASELSSATTSTRKTPEATRVVRNTSYALRGLAPLMRASASIEVNTENVQAQPPSGRAIHDLSNETTPTASIKSNSLSLTSPEIDSEKYRPASRMSEMSSIQERPSKPIQIRSQDTSGSPDVLSSRRLTTQPAKQLSIPTKSKDPFLVQDRASTNDLSPSLSENEERIQSQPGSLADSVPQSKLPFIRNVNASNPLKNDPDKATTFGRWQHLYPRKPRAATVKWRSLCTPASVPLTTEDFPSREELELEYEVSSYLVTLENSNDMLELPESRDHLFREMLSLRFAHGYQLVVGPNLDSAFVSSQCDPSFFFMPNRTRSDGEFVFMSMGNAIQKISLDAKFSIRVSRYVRKVPEVQPPYPSSLNYNPNIRTILSDKYKHRTVEIKGFSEQYPWDAADAYLADPKKRHDSDVHKLRFWRARFVLLPVEPPENAFRPNPSQSEENEEEVHLRGIRALTQMWQKSRFVPPDERRPALNRASAMKKKDRNPLQINLETLNPSELVATELDKLLAAEEAGDMSMTQLLPEEQQFERETATLTKVAQAMQGDRGIEIKHRRWHIAVWYHCFQGEEFTNWLVLNFRDIDTRDEAEEFGNELMKEGMFSHVSNRHVFKDGNYFYTISPQYRAARPDLNKTDLRSSLFFGSRRSERSVPATPHAENPPKEFSLTVRSRSGSNLAQQPNVHVGSELGKTLSEKKRLAVTLSKMIRIDVDTRKRSDRPEIVHLHYDRLHNPENCYHLELAWLNVTSKLVDDAIVAWTTQAEKYGLKLVEVPIAEARLVPENEPFRAPYRIKLVSEPPDRAMTSSIYTATSFTPQSTVKKDSHYFQKALLKKFNFVLDMEAVSEFPDNVEIQYSWGKLNYEDTQFVHRSGVVLAQITGDGEFLLLANRLYNARHASIKDVPGAGKDVRRQLAFVPTYHLPSTFLSSSTHNLRNPYQPQPSPGPVPISTPSPRANVAQPPVTAMQASGIIGLNVQSPSATSSPIVRPTLTVPSSSSTTAFPRTTPALLAIARTNTSTYVTPESIKDDLEAFCHDPNRLDAFYKDLLAAEEQKNNQHHLHPTPLQTPVTTGGIGSDSASASTTSTTATMTTTRRKGAGHPGGTNSSLLRPYIPPPEDDYDIEGLPGLAGEKFQLPPAVVGPHRAHVGGDTSASSKIGTGTGLEGQQQQQPQGKKKSVG